MIDCHLSFDYLMVSFKQLQLAAVLHTYTVYMYQPALYVSMFYIQVYTHVHLGCLQKRPALRPPIPLRMFV